jgi:hypothetical protein
MMTHVQIYILRYFDSLRWPTDFSTTWHVNVVIWIDIQPSDVVPIKARLHKRFVGQNVRTSSNITINWGGRS